MKPISVSIFTAIYFAYLKNGGRLRTMVKRFQDIDWYCDRCNAYLNSQDNFDDHKYIWSCTECGYKKSISSTNVLET